jgi:membrane-associated phospholipid phosphatase
MADAFTAIAQSERPWGRAALWLALLGPFFFASYGFATWFTAQRSNVGSVVFAWERSIPFVPWTIVPYWSIDLLYGLSLFACADRRELDTHAKRLLTAQIIAVACFLLLPLTFTFDRPDTDGVFGLMFKVLAGFDKPFNQAPSLHIALLVIIWALFARKVAGPMLLVLHGWFVLIGVSVLTTWQHHFIDIPTGALLGFFCLWLWPQGEASPSFAQGWTVDPQRRKLALYYMLGAALAASIAVVIAGAALWLLWVSVALALVAMNYAMLGPMGFQKRDGRLSPAATAMLAPYLAGAFVNVRAWTRDRPAPDHVVDGIWLGRLPTRGSLAQAKFAGVVDLSCELPVDVGDRGYANFPVLDLTLPDAALLKSAADAIERLRSGGPVLVCCALGYSRSAMAVVAWLLVTGRDTDVGAAIARIERARPRIVLSDAHRTVLSTLAVRLENTR